MYVELMDRIIIGALDLISICLEFEYVYAYIHAYSVWKHRF